MHGCRRIACALIAVSVVMLFQSASLRLPSTFTAIAHETITAGVPFYSSAGGGSGSTVTRQKTSGKSADQKARFHTDALTAGRVAMPSSSSSSSSKTDQQRLRAAFLHSFSSYEQYAWGHDELKPLSKGANDVWGGFAITMVDALDTAWMLGFRAEFDRSVSWLATNLTLQRDHYVSVFEMSIRLLGGLLSGYDLSGDHRLLAKAAETGLALLPAFARVGLSRRSACSTRCELEHDAKPPRPSPATPSPFLSPHRRRAEHLLWQGLPSAQLNMRTGRPRSHTWASALILAEVGSVQLEFRRLVQLLRAHAGSLVSPEQLRGLEAAAASFDKVLASPSSSGLFGRFLGGGEYAINGGCDSFYEYILKIWLLGGQSEARYARKPRVRSYASEALRQKPCVRSLGSCRMCRRSLRLDMPGTSVCGSHPHRFA